MRRVRRRAKGNREGRRVLEMGNGEGRRVMEKGEGLGIRDGGCSRERIK